MGEYQDNPAAALKRNGMYNNALGASRDTDSPQIVLIMVGLPARGKSLIAGKIVRFLKWQNATAKIFNVGSYRRNDNPHPEANFFDINNKEGERARRAAAEAAVADMLEWFKDKNNKVGILDATNSTKARRKWIYEKVNEAGLLHIFIESICDDESIIMHNILDVKTTSPDYVGQDPEAAAKDFRERIKNYEKVYETIDDTEKEYSFIKISNVNRRIQINKMVDYLQTRIVYYLTNLHIKPRSIWLSRHGESQYNLTKQIGGDADLSENGWQYANLLPDLLRQSGIPTEERVVVWTSTLKRTNQTAKYVIEQLGFRKLEWKALDEIDSGICDHMTYAQIAEKYPEDFAARDDDKYNYRYPGGESYKDVVQRLEPIIMELEREENVIIITHQAILRCIWAYFKETPPAESPWQNIPLHTLVKLTPRAYGNREEVFKSGIKAVSTHRRKGEVEEGVEEKEKEK